ncbi:TPA: cation transporter [bacterium]|nr:MAG: hypothetical protein AUJ18_07585 [Candidatus Hydrogenedentes bacterium CG1_02_42_14]PIU47580.1 MAG: cation transporter [Candidatus Hydrogenedentes bacterium CG07_land_8_20_14_0_80_42_17]HBW47809.1 cation transporter [bacterium]
MDEKQENHYLDSLKRHSYGHSGQLRKVALNRLWITLGLNLAFLILEVVGGLWTNSLALLSDAGHMLTDVLAIALTIVATKLATRPPTPNRTFGLMRIEIIGAFMNGGSLVIIVGVIFWEAIHRLFAPPEVQGAGMLIIAVAGLAANAVSAWILLPNRRDNLNMEGAFLHMMADAIGSVGAIFAAVVIQLTGWNAIDPIASFFIGFLILWGGIGLLKKSGNVLLNAIPTGIEYSAVKSALESNEHVEEVYDLHIWSITDTMPALSAHIRLKPECADTQHWQSCLRQMQDMLHDRFEIEHSTLQLESGTHEKDDRMV